MKGDDERTVESFEGSKNRFIELVDKLYNLTPEEIAIVEGKNE